MEMQRQILKWSLIPWKRKVRYLGIKMMVPLDPDYLSELNLTLSMNTIQQQLAGWNTLKLSWFNRCENENNT